MIDEQRIAYLEHVDVTKDAIGEQATIAYLGTEIQRGAQQMESFLKQRVTAAQRTAAAKAARQGGDPTDASPWVSAFRATNGAACVAEEIVDRRADDQRTLMPLVTSLRNHVSVLKASTVTYRSGNEASDFGTQFSTLSQDTGDLCDFVQAPPGSTIRGLISLRIVGVKAQQFLGDARQAFDDEKGYIFFPDSVDRGLNFVADQATRLANRSDLAALCASPDDVRAEVDRLCQVIQDALVAIEEIECAIEELECETGLSASCNRLKRELDEAAHWMAAGMFLACHIDVQEESDAARLRRYWKSVLHAAKGLLAETKEFALNQYCRPCDLCQGGPAHLLDMTKQGLREADAFLDSACLCDVPQHHIDLAERVYAQVSNLYGKSHTLSGDFDHGIFRQFWVPLAGIRMLLCDCPDDDKCDTTEGKVAKLVHLFDEIRSEVEHIPCRCDGTGYTAVQAHDDNTASTSGTLEVRSAFSGGGWRRRQRGHYGRKGCRHGQRGSGGTATPYGHAPSCGCGSAHGAATSIGWSPFAQVSWGPVDDPTLSGASYGQCGPAGVTSPGYWITLQDSIKELLPKVSGQSKLLLQKASQESGQVLHVLNSQTLPQLTTERAVSSSNQVVSLIRGAIGHDKSSAEMWKEAKQKLQALEASVPA